LLLLRHQTNLILYVCLFFVHTYTPGILNIKHSCTKPLLIRNTLLHHMHNLLYKHIKNLEANDNPFIKIILLKILLLKFQVSEFTGKISR